MADNIQVKDAAGTSRILKTTEEGGTLIHTPHHVVDTAPATAAEGAALPGVFTVVAGDDGPGTPTHPLASAMILARFHRGLLQCT